MPEANGDEAIECTPELESLRDTIFTPSCAIPTCHSSADMAGGLDLENVDLDAQLVGQPSSTCDGWIRVVPQAPDESLLYAKVAGPAPCGGLMPSPEGLPPEQSACVRTWIENLDGVDCETCGGAACVDLDHDIDNCGTCGNSCPNGTACMQGSCTCPNGLALCNEECIDVDTDPLNCGDCNDACAGDEVCLLGECTNGCGALTECGGECVDTNTNPNHCGACNNACAFGDSCDEGSCGCPGDGVSFSAEVEPLLVDNCANKGCHSFPSVSAGLDLGNGSAYANLVGVPSVQCNMRMLVAPGQPDASYLIDKLEGHDMCSGKQMPKAGAPMSAAEIAMISEWICRGAPDN